MQEIDIETGKVLFEWHSLDHVPVDESYRARACTAAGNVDYFHLNSIEVDADGHLLVSARHTSTVYKVDRKTGAVKWRLGGKRSDFAIGDGRGVQLPARRPPPRRRHADACSTTARPARRTDVEPSSRVMRLKLDLGAMTADLVSAVRAGRAAPRDRDGRRAAAPEREPVRRLGHRRRATASSTPAATCVIDAKLSGGNMTYRAFRLPWTGRPATKPAIAAILNGDGTTTVSASWNGATEVAGWRFLAGPKAAQFRTAATAPRAGFETSVTLQTASGAVAAVALDAHGKALGRTGIVRLTPSAS